MRSKEKKPKTTPEGFNEGEYLSQFREIDDALEEHIRSARGDEFQPVDEEPPFQSVHQLLSGSSAKDRQMDSEDEMGGGLPFSSLPKEEKTDELAISGVPETIIYRQARRSKRIRKGKQGIWRFLPHIGHRKRHWLQRNFPALTVALLLVLGLCGFYLVRVRPRIALAGLDDFAAASRAHEEMDFDAAIALYEQFLRSSPRGAFRTVQARYYLGCSYENIGQLAKAREQYWQVWQEYERHLERMNEEQFARRHFDRSLPDIYPHALYNLGLLSWREGDYDVARGYFERLIEEFPNYMFLEQVRQLISQRIPEEVLVPEVAQDASFQEEGQDHEPVE